MSDEDQFYEQALDELESDNKVNWHRTSPTRLDEYQILNLANIA